MTDTKEQFADVSVQRLAGVYAESLLNAAEHAGQVEAVLEELDSLIDDVFKSDVRLEMLLSGAVMGRDARDSAIRKAFGTASPVFQSFLHVLSRQDRLELIRPIRQAVHRLYDERHRRIRIHVDSAVPLPNEFQERIRQMARERFDREPVLILNVDPKLLGGLKVRIGDRQYDSTVLTRIDNLRNQLITSGSHEIQSQRNRFSPDE